MGSCFRYFCSVATLFFEIILAAPCAAGAAPAENTPEIYAGEISGARGSLSLRAELSPAVNVSLSSRAAGIIEVIHVPEGSPVKAGQSIISLDSSQERAELAQAEASMRGAKADLDHATAEFERTQRLSDIQSTKDLEAAKTQAAIALSRFDQATAIVDLARVKLANRDIVSPKDGIFLKTNKRVGEAVERYETVARVVDITSLEMQVYCDAKYFSLFKVDQKVDVRVLKSPDKPTEEQPMISGTVFHVDPVIEAGLFRVKVRIEPSSDAVPGFWGILIAPTR